MLAETLAGIALVKSAVDGIKSAIGTAKDVGEIAGHIDNLLTGEKQVQEQRARKSGVSLGDQFGIKSVAQEVIDARLAQESLNEMRTMVDMRFIPIRKSFVNFCKQIGVLPNRCRIVEIVSDNVLCTFFLSFIPMPQCVYCKFFHNSSLRTYYRLQM